MTIYGFLAPGTSRIARWGSRTDLVTPAARRRLAVLDWHRAHGANVSLTARHFALTRETVGTWVQRFRTAGLPGLADRSTRPTHLRTPTTSSVIVTAVVRWRKQYPAWSKHKLAVLIAREDGLFVSASTVGRILKRRGLVDVKKARKRQRAALHPKRRFPRGFTVRAPGAFVQVDTKFVVVTGGVTYFQFTATDVLTKLRVLRAYRNQTALTATLFLQELLTAFPFPVQAIQSDNGAPFLGTFQKRLIQRGITHYFTHPHTPKENTYVERSHGSDEREFYQQGNHHPLLVTLQRKLAAWEMTWNTFRPHQALNYLTPQAYYRKWKTTGIETKDYITLQT